ncbi:MAG: hypothetical protein IH624_02520 [Phycisphaerae bacterium]|nr:hypothetical protein [Phycisphaerae bacterium]
MFSEQACLSKFSRITAVLMLTACMLCAAEAAYKPVEGRIMTRWAKDVSPERVHPEYPRPQMVRKDWKNLNGLWEYAIQPKDAMRPSAFDGEILVPFAIESALSGVGKTVTSDQRLWYRRTFDLPADWADQRILLHFGAVDWETTVWVNGKEVGSHKGGFDPFTLDITDAISKQGKQELLVSVWDPTDAGPQPRGKQIRNPHGIWYTPVTGIWQTVWLEPVGKTSIRSLKITPDIDARQVRIVVDARNAAGCTFEAKARTAGFASAAAGTEGDMTIAIPEPKLWSPDSPHLYDLTVRVLKDGRAVDTVDAYFGMRKIAVQKDETGVNRLFLNNKALFQYGPLDQGWWPDGLYTAPTDEALRYDLEITRELGCNMLRKHVKVEPARLYYWCDKLGLLVWQDMPSANNRPGSHDQFELELKRMIDAFYNHPSIVMWVPFNEGWGQYDTERVTAWTKKYDPSRLVNNASGWTDKGVGDVHDIHAYPGPACPPLEESRAVVLGEFGGLGLPVVGHTWQDQKNWGYRSYEDSAALTDAYIALLQKLRPLIGNGLAAAVYTQTTDVEIEVNGFMTYDRAMIKMDAARIAEAARKLYLPPPVVTTVIATSEIAPSDWAYTTAQPADDWYKGEFDDSTWKRGPAGFGTRGTPGTVVRTQWNTSDIWIRRSFDLKTDDLGDLQLIIHHDEDAEVYLNGQLVLETTGYTSSYAVMSMKPNAARALKKGANVIAIHCRQTSGGQYIDAGLVSVKERAR